MELVAQGAGNIGSALFGGIPATGVIARTAANVRSGGRTSIGAGMVITVVLFMKMVSEETEVKGWKYYCDDDSQVAHLRELPKSVSV